MRSLPAFALALLMLLSGHQAQAQRVALEIASREIFVDEPARVVLRIEDAEGFEGPSTPPPEMLAAAGLEVVRLPGEQSSRSVQIVNGRRTERSTVTIAFEVTPRREGATTIPPFTISFAGRELRTAPVPVTVSRSETGDLLRVSAHAAPDPIFVGQEGVLRLEIAVKRYRDAEFGITLDEGSIWSLIDRDGSDWGVFGNALIRMLSEGRRPRGELREIAGSDYIVFTLERPFDPITTGEPSLGDVRIRMDYPTRLRRGSGFLGDSRLTLAASRPISARVAETRIAVRSVPSAAAPASWNGAVGLFELEVEARPTSVAVGDPITLTITLTDRSGKASLGGLQSPPLADAPSLVDRFRVARDAAPGTVDGRRKVFTQTIRALSEAVTEIPPIEFTAYEPMSGEFRTLRSSPIPISVRPSAVVRAVEPAGAEASNLAGAAPRAEFTRVERGLLANASLAECGVRGEVAPLHLALGAVPLAAALAVPLVGRLARSRAIARADAVRRARVDAERAIAAATGPDGLEEALLRYVAARCDAATPAVSRKDACALLAGFGVADEAIARFDAFLRRCERARYTGERLGNDEAQHLLRQIEAETAKGSAKGNAAAERADTRPPRETRT